MTQMCCPAQVSVAGVLNELKKTPCTIYGDEALDVVGIVSQPAWRGSCTHEASGITERRAEQRHRQRFCRDQAGPIVDCSGLPVLTTQLPRALRYTAAQRRPRLVQHLQMMLRRQDVLSGTSSVPTGASPVLDVACSGMASRTSTMWRNVLRISKRTVVLNVRIYPLDLPLHRIGQL